MGKISIAALLVALVVAAAQASEYADNPDHCPSIGLNYTGTSMSGDATVKDTGLTAKQNVETVSGVITLDTRIPISNSTTLYGSFGLVGGKNTADETSQLLGGETKVNGVQISLGARWYLH